MKRWLSLIGALALVMLFGSVSTAEARPYMPGDPEVRIIKFQVGNNQYTYQDGSGAVQTVTMDVAPYIKHLAYGDRVMLPARFVVEAMGGRAEYNEKTTEIGLFRKGQGMTGNIGEGIMLHFYPGKSEMVWCGRVPMSIDTPVEIVNDRSFAPLRAVAQGMGALVFWDNQTQTAIIETPMITFTPVGWGWTTVPGHTYYAVEKETHTKNSKTVPTQDVSVGSQYMFSLNRPVIVTSPGNSKLCSIDMLQEFELLGGTYLNNSKTNQIFYDPARKGMMVFNTITGYPFVQVYQRLDGTGDYWEGPTEVYTQWKQNSYFDKKVYFTSDYRFLTDLTGFDLAHAVCNHRTKIQSFNGKTLVTVNSDL